MCSLSEKGDVLMKLKDSQTLFGVPIVHLREHSKKYRLRSSLLYVFDLLLVFGATAYMFFNNVSYEAYGFVLVAICITINFIMFFKLGVETWEVFKFFKKYSNCEVVNKKYDVTGEVLYSVLYCTGYKRLKQNLSLKEYEELMLSACCENVKYANSLMKHLAKYESESGNVECYVISKGSKQYLIDFVSNNIEEASLDECNHTGTVEESDSRPADCRDSVGEGLQHSEDQER